MENQQKIEQVEGVLPVELRMERIGHSDASSVMPPPISVETAMTFVMSLLDIA